MRNEVKLIETRCKVSMLESISAAKPYELSLKTRTVSLIKPENCKS